MIYIKKIRGATRADLAQIVAIDAGITGLRKPAYWSGILSRYGTRQRHRYFLVAENDRAVQGYIADPIKFRLLISTSCPPDEHRCARRRGSGKMR